MFKQWVKNYERQLAILAAAAGLTAILSNFEFTFLEARLYDFRMTRGALPEPDPRILLVELDDATTRTLDEFAPLSLDYHAQLLEKIAKLRPRAVGYLVNMNHVNQVNPDQFPGEWGTRFMDAVRRMESEGTSFAFGTPFDVSGEVVPPFPLGSLSHAIAVVHKDGNVFSSDKVTRRALTRFYDRPTFHMLMAQSSGLVPEGFRPRGSFRVPEAESEYFFFRYHGSTVLPSAGPAETADPARPIYRRISFLDVLEGRVPDDTWAGKIVLVGTLSRQNPGDFATTPFSAAPFQSPKLFIHAHILDSILHDNGVVMAPRWLNWAITFLASLAVLGWVLNSTPLYGVFATLGLGLFILLLGQLVFQELGPWNGVWIEQSHPLVAIALAYYLVVPYRLIREYKKRWDYQRRTEILTQVEELKTNFLSLVTHDLKTPVARIQGLAEVLLSKAGERLVERDKETVNHIISSTDELNRFISSILELTKIESNRLKLNLESRDVNQLVERAVAGFKAQARASRIELAADLEPLFPIKLDPSLISKVLNNLLDNALKYSPGGSTVVVRTREAEECVEISVCDQGVGLSPEEIDSLFTKFYRAKNDATAKVHGTGLGLYLSRYFIEAHMGRVEVESVKGGGSTFRIVLRQDLEIDGIAGFHADAVRGPASARASIMGFLPGLSRRISRKKNVSSGSSE
ncbi:MAG: CHASE2 domain-containing protein [Bdellovibrionales bacterium]|nr:CHASE2 domain-containing protein [Bdellovibrionales bacterium]